MWFYIALTSTVIFSFYGILSTVLSVKSKDPRVLSIVFNLICGVISFALGITELSHFSQLTLPLILLILASIISYAVFGRYEFLNASVNETSVRYIFHPLSSITTTILAVLFYHEGFTLVKTAGIILILLANVVAYLGFQSKNKITRDGWIYMLLTYIPLGVAWSIDKTVGSEFPIFLYIAITYTLPALLNMVLLRKTVSDLIDELKLLNWKVLILSLQQVIGYSLLVYAFTLGESSKVSFVQATEDVLAILLGIVLLKEREHINIKIIAGIIAFVGIILLR